MGDNDGGKFIQLAATVARATSILTANIPTCSSNRAYCGDCRGKGFDLTRATGKRSARKCQRCRGTGSTPAGTTKR